VCSDRDSDVQWALNSVSLKACMRHCYCCGRRV